MQIHLLATVGIFYCAEIAENPPLFSPLLSSTKMEILSHLTESSAVEQEESVKEEGINNIIVLDDERTLTKIVHEDGNIMNTAKFCVMEILSFNLFFMFLKFYF